MVREVGDPMVFVRRRWYGWVACAEWVRGYPYFFRAFSRDGVLRLVDEAHADRSKEPFEGWERVS